MHKLSGSGDSEASTPSNGLPGLDSDDFRRLLGRRIRTLQTARGVTQQQLAEVSGVDRTDLSRIENGKKLPSIPTLRALAIALDVKVDDLLREEKWPLTIQV